MNQHIKDYMTHYLSIEKVEHAILLSGKWGCGKTYFIDKFIADNANNKDIKFIKISLFGLKDTGAIDDEIFQNLHPILGSKYARFASNLLKSAIKIGVNFDLNGDGQSDGNINTDISSFNPMGLLADKSGKPTEIIFVFDDLERTDIDIKEVLGYINYLVEQNNFKTIVLANEEKLIKEYKETYTDFKEKVIGKTFEVRHNFSEVLEQFLRSIDIKNFDKSIVEKVYHIARYENLRHVKQIIIDFNYFIENINEKYLENTDFLSNLTYIFFALSIEIKSGNIDEKKLLDYKDCFLKGDKSNSTASERQLKKYNFGLVPLFSEEDWVKILFKGQINKDELNSYISKLHYFISEIQPSWVKLWHYWEQEDNKFDELLNDIIDKFKKYNYQRPDILLHVIALLVYFNQMGLSDYPIGDIEKQMIKCLKSCFQPDGHKDKQYYLVEDLWAHNNTGLSYMNSDDKNFLRLFEKFKVENIKLYKAYEEQSLQQKLDEFIVSVNSGKKDHIYNFLLERNEYTPVLAKLNAKDFFNALLVLPNARLNDINRVMRSRYSDNKYSNGEQYGNYLRDELPFWQKLKQEFKSLDYSQFKIKKIILEDFERYVVDRIIEKMSNK